MLDQAVRNMLTGCGDIRPGDTVLIVHEPPGLGYYDDALAPAVAQSAQAQGFQVALREAPFSQRPEMPPDLAAAMARHRLTVFFARIGDQIRFRPEGAAQRAIVSYAIDLDRFASPFGGIAHARMLALRDCVDAAIAQAAEVRVTCRNGTDLKGRVAGPEAPSDSHTRRFPQLVYTPVPATGFSGRIALRGFLVGTGSQFYTPYALGLTGTLGILVEGNRITGFDGPDAAAAQAHYESIAARLGIDPFFVHSWHGGLHPSCRFDGPASAGFERWSGAAFGNPRLLHLHSCGAYAPGEISLNIADATVLIDGVPVWEDGRFHPDRVPGASDVLRADPQLAAAFASPEQACGLGPDGQLSFA